MKFLKILAQNKRDLSSAKFIAVTGSSGKTTIKTMLGNLLKKYSNSYFSPQSYNNQYGVPLSVCNIGPQDDFGVFEIGMSKFKEILIFHHWLNRI
jgi:murE/murF fusion protein